ALAAGEADPARGNAAPEQGEEPLRRVFAQVAERRHAGESPALEARIGIAMDQVDGGLEPEASVDPRDAGERLAHDEGHGLRIGPGRVRLASPAHVAPAASGKRLGLVAEVAKNRIVTAASPLDPANHLEEESPLVLEHRGGRRTAVAAALEERAA